MGNIIQLTEDQMNEYNREGYLVVRNVVPAEVVDRVLEAAFRLQRTVENGDSAWQYISFNHQNPFQDSALHEILSHPRVCGLVAQLLDSEPRVFYGMLAVVPAGGGKGLPWHQDNQYEHIFGKALNTFVALSEITPEKANLWVVPGSHTNGLLPYKMSETFQGHRENLEEPKNPVLLPTLHKGDVCIFSRYMLHRSLTNSTTEDRFAYAAQYCEKFSRKSTDGTRYERIMAAELYEKVFAGVSA